MKRILLTVVATLMMCLGVSAQIQYVMKITKSDGSSIELNADDVKDVTFLQTGTPIVYAPHHFDLTVTVGKQGGMGRDVTTIMQSRDRLDQGAVVDFKNAGAEINADYSMEAIVKGKYYYQVPVSADRFVKLQFKDNQMQVIKQRPFKENTYNTRQYTHAWINDNTLVIMAANGDKDAIVWTKLNTDDMSIISEGTLNISLGSGWDSFTTSGILTYRESDNKLFYFYYNKKGSGRKAVNEDFFHIAVINAQTMVVEQDIINSQGSEMAGSAYGELLQNSTFFDEQGNLYLATLTNDLGQLLRIKKGEFNFEAGYNGFPNSDGKLLTAQYMGKGKVLTFSRHNDSALGTGIDSYAYYYSIVDMNNKTRTRLACNGTEIPYSSGSFSQRTAYDPSNGKAYIGVNTENAQPQIYVYDVKTGAVSEGVKVAEGYYFEQIRLVED
ncbi:MAG: hypothetical protein K6G32_05190 [Prevotella sp.]|nr:hypothetical protein [Prevotella sp.]